MLSNKQLNRNSFNNVINCPGCLACLQSLSLPLIPSRRCVSISTQGLPGRTLVFGGAGTAVLTVSAASGRYRLAVIRGDLYMLQCLSSELKQPLSAWGGKGRDRV